MECMPYLFINIPNKNFNIGKMENYQHTFAPQTIDLSALPFHIGRMIKDFLEQNNLHHSALQRTVNMYHGLLKQFMEENYNMCNPEHYIFSHGGVPGEKLVSKNIFGMRWNDYRKHFNIDASYKLYGSKHTGGKRVTKKTNAYITMEHFGHSSLQQTQHYINDLDKNELKFLQTEFPQFASAE